MDNPFKSFEPMDGFLFSSSKGAIFFARDGEKEIACRAPIETLLALSAQAGKHHSALDYIQAGQIFMAHKSKIVEAARRKYLKEIFMDNAPDRDGWMEIQSIDLGS